MRSWPCSAATHRGPPGAARSFTSRRRTSGCSDASDSSIRRPGGLPRLRRLRGALEGDGDGARRRHRRGGRLEARGPRRRRLPDRPQVGRRRQTARAAALPRLQRRRVRARDLQGPHPPRAGSVRGRRVDDDCGLRDRMRQGLRLRPRRVSARGPTAAARHRRGARGRPARRIDILGSGFSLRHRDPPRRRRVHLRRGDRALRVDRGAERLPAEQAALPGRRRPLRQADRRQQRRDAASTSRGSSSREARRSRRSGRRRRRGRRLFCVSGHVRAPGVYEVPFGTTLRTVIELAGGVRGRPRHPDGAARRRCRHLRAPRTSSTSRSRTRTRATAGATLGSGVVLVLDDSIDLRDIVLRIAAFFRDESCGQCVPCRVGVVRQEEALHRIAAGTPAGRPRRPSSRCSTMWDGR